MKWSRLIVGVIWLLATLDPIATCLGAGEESFEDDPDDWDELDDTDSAETSGDLFGILSISIVTMLLGGRGNAKFACEKVAPNEFVTKRLGLIRTIFRTIREPDRYTRGKCRKLCPDLCACFSDGYDAKLLSRKCICKGEGTVCGRNAECSAQKECQCRAGYEGDGQTCCGTTLPDQFLCRARQPATLSPRPGPIRTPAPAPTLLSPALLPSFAPPTLLGPAVLPSFAPPTLTGPAVLPSFAPPTLTGPAVLPVFAPPVKTPAALPTRSPVASTKQPTFAVAPAPIPVNIPPIGGAPFPSPAVTPSLDPPAIRPPLSTRAPARLPTAVPVVDSTPPQLVGFILRTPRYFEASVPTKPAEVNVTILALDDGSGCCSRVVFSARGPSVLSAVSPQSTRVRGLSEHNVTIKWPEYGNTAHNETYELDVELTDVKGNIAKISSSDLAQRGFASTIQVWNAPDTTGPALLDFRALSGTTIDVTAEPAKVDFQLVVQDESDVRFGRVRAELPEGIPSSQFSADGYAPPKNARSPTVINVTLEFPSILKQNFTWQVKLDVFLIDQYNNVREISTNELSSRSLLSNIVFVSSPALPKLLNFTVNPTTLSTTRTVTMQITVQRGSHFFSSGAVDFFRSNSQSAAYQAAFAPTSAPTSSQNVTQYTTNITLSASEVNQAFKLAVTLYDTKGNKLVVASDQLIAGGFPGMVNVLN